MRKISLIASLFAISSIVPVAQAATGTIEFKGVLTAATCQITGPTGSTITIPLGTISIEDVPATGGTPPVATGSTFFNVECAGTAGVNTVAMKFDPAAGSGLDKDSVDLLRLAPAIGANVNATGVGIGLLNESNALIKLGSGETFDNALMADGTDPNKSTAKISLRAAYFKTTGNTPTAGVANATMPFTLTYK